jgi:hypothetical protein
MKGFLRGLAAVVLLTGVAILLLLLHLSPG